MSFCWANFKLCNISCPRSLNFRECGFELGVLDFIFYINYSSLSILIPFEKPTNLDLSFINESAIALSRRVH